MKEAALLLSLQHAVLSDPHPAGREGGGGSRKGGRGREQEGRKVGRGIVMLKLDT